MAEEPISKSQVQDHSNPRAADDYSECLVQYTCRDKLESAMVTQGDTLARTTETPLDKASATQQSDGLLSPLV